MFARKVWLASPGLALVLGGCSGVLDPKGPVGASARLILLDSLAIMLTIVVPLILAIFAFTWWFRAGNPRALYRPHWNYSGQLELIVWAVPAIVVTFLGGLAWFGSHTLDPYERLPSKQAAVEIEVVSLDWKWLFIYPAEGIATVNTLVIPVGRPVHFRLTSSGVMNSFFVPQLGSQIYTMAGMVSQLNLQADTPGAYHGLSAQFSGAGFADMQFEVRAVTPAEYAGWLEQSRKSDARLDPGSYASLAKPGSSSQRPVFGAVSPQLFDSIARGASAPDPGAPPGGPTTKKTT